MRFGLAILPEHAWSVAEPMWREADAMGFDHLWTFDHITWAGLPESPWFAAVPTLAAAAAVTSRTRLGTFVSSPNNHHPVQFMREVLALDDISGGRFVLGIGSGGDLDSQITGDDLPLKQRVARFAEFTELLDRLLREERVSAEGEFYAAREVLTRPGPVRGLPDGHRVPLVVAANGPKAMRLAVEHGDAWMTYGGNADTDDAWWDLIGSLGKKVDAALAQAGRDPSTLDRYLNLDSAPTFSLTTAAAFDDAVGRAAELGFTDVITHWPRATDPFEGRREVLDDVAAHALPRLRGAGPGPAAAG